jgi:nucleotide-binding universal stress UspA family protein
VTNTTEAKQVINEKNDLIHDQQPTVKKILMAIDKSGYKDKITVYAVMLAKVLGADLTAIHVLDKSSLGFVGGLLSYYRGGKIEVYVDALKKQAEELLAEAEVLGKKEGVRMNVEVLMHSPSIAEGIIDYAKRNDMELIVVGTKGLTGVEKFLIGSVASNVIAHAHCPVMAIR